MKFPFITIMTLLFLFSCSSPKNKSQYTSGDLQGHWHLIDVELIEEKQSLAKYEASKEVDFVSEEPSYVYLDNGIIRPHSPDFIMPAMKDMVFYGDSTYRLSYPLERNSSYYFKVENDTLKINEGHELGMINLSSEKDTLVISYLDGYGMYIEETYLKSTFDDGVLNILKLYTTNFPELAGTWKLIREDNDGYGGEYTLNFPYEVPDTIVMSKEELESTLHIDRSYQMLTSGEKRKYFLEFNWGRLQLTPDHWCEGECQQVLFFRRLED